MGQFLAIVDTIAPFPVQENPTAQNHGESPALFKHENQSFYDRCIDA